MINIINRYKKLRIVIAHLLAPNPSLFDIWIDTLTNLKNENVWFDIAALPWFISGESYPFSTTISFLAHAKNIVGAEHLIWGSDSPILLTIATYEQLLEYVITSNIFKNSELEKVMCKNAEVVYKI